MTGKRPRIGFVVQRCGEEVNGGSEALCLAIATHIQSIWDVEILTTRAIDYTTWDNHYSEGLTDVRGVPVRRFSVSAPRVPSRFNALCDELFSRPGAVTINEAEDWMDEQGPTSPSLLAYLKDHREDYDAFVFFTYLYATTYRGLPLVADRAYLVPTAHDEPPAHLPIWDDWFRKPRSFVFNTPEEKQFLERRFPSVEFSGEVAGMGIDPPEDWSGERFREQYDIHDPYMLYAGRIDVNKGSLELFDYFCRYKAQSSGRLKLILIGKPVIDVPMHRDIRSLGFVDEQTKFDAIAGADLVVNPSPFESLSIILLEAWYLNRPVLVSAKSDVMVGQCKRSNGGLWYEGYPEFEACIDALSKNSWIAKSGQQFVESNYSWPHIIEKYRMTAIRDESKESASC